jgi:tRNA-dihydrouridine synthase A
MEKVASNYTPHLQNIDLEKLLNTKTDETPEMKAISHRISLAPMMDVTNVHFRFLMRLLTKHMILYTEMIHENTILNYKGGYEKLLHFNPTEHPVVLQIGGNCPERLAKCAKIAEDLGYDEVNINVGCPSERVQSGAFGACLMKEPELVAEFMNSMQSAVKIPITIKTRLGVDDFDSYEFAYDFIKKTNDIAGTKHYIMHARKAFLKGLDPVKNRNIPPLMYDRVIRLKEDFPHIDFSINGGFKTIESIKEVLKPENKLVGCMIGRITYDHPWLLSDVDRVFYGQKNPGYTRREVLEIYAEYAQRIYDAGIERSYAKLAKPVMNLFAYEAGSMKYKQILSDHSIYKKSLSYKEFLFKALEAVEKVNPAALDTRPPTGDSDNESAIKVSSPELV